MIISLGKITTRIKNYTANRLTIESSKKAAIIIPIFIETDSISLLFARKNPSLKYHGNQITFPGGKIDQNESPYEAALRELKEEVSISERHVTKIGLIDSQYTPVSNFTVSPFVCKIDLKATIKPDNHEIVELYKFHLEDLYTSKKPDPTLGEHQYVLNGVRIWGLTARILDNFFRIILQK